MKQWFAVFLILVGSVLVGGFSASAKAAETAISGTVKSKDGKGLEGATIRVTGTALGAISKKNGAFRFRCRKPKTSH